MKKLPAFLVSLALLTGSSVCAADPDIETEPAKTDNPVEAGAVAWLHDYDAATAKSKETGKPIFLLFQEIPGCGGCKQFGKEVMSAKLIVEAVESEFVPLLVPNGAPLGIAIVRTSAEELVHCGPTGVSRLLGRPKEEGHSCPDTVRWLSRRVLRE